MQSVNYKFLAGIDWGSQSHQVCVIDQSGSILGERSFPHGGKGLGEMVQWIVDVCESGPQQVAAAIEVPHGPVVESLMARGFCVHSINPKQLDRFRDRFSPSGAKDDRRDAHVLASALGTDIRHFRRLTAPEPIIIELRELSRMREELVGERTRLAARMRTQLWKYYPQFNELIGERFHPWLLELWQRVPTPQAARRARPRTIEKLLKRHGIRRIDAKGVLEILRSKEMNIFPATASGCVMRVQSIVERMIAVLRQLKDAEKLIDSRIISVGGSGRGEAEFDDVEILLSIPGVGKIVLAAMLGEACELFRRRDYKSLRSLSGVAPVTRQSGKSKRVTQRRASHKRLVNAIYHWARTAIQGDPASRAKYNALRGRGHGHYRALRSVGDRLLYVACTLLEKGVLFEKNFATS